MSQADLDRIDRKILHELMKDATLPVALLAERVGLSQTPCWKRVQKLEAAGVIERWVAIVDPEKIGLGLAVFVEIEALDHTPEAAGLLAASLGLSRMYSDDLEQLDAEMLLYDAFYRWARDATDETHNWPTNKPKAD